MATHSLEHKPIIQGAYAVCLANIGRLLKHSEIVDWKPAVIMLKNGDRIEIPLMLCDTAKDVVDNIDSMSKFVGDNTL